MRRLLCAVPLLLAIPAMAQIQYPEPNDPFARQTVERYQKDASMVTSPDFTKMPASPPAWPCDVPEIDQYKLSGLIVAHPESKKDIDKQIRKAIRQADMNAAAGVNQKYSDIQFAPIVAQCKDGKIDGEIQLLVSYRMQMETKNTTLIGEKATTMTTVIDSTNVKRRHLTVKDGQPSGLDLAVTRSVSSTKMSSDDPATNSMMSSMLNRKPAEILTVIYSDNEANGLRMASFAEIDDMKASSGFLGPNIKTQKALQSTFVLPVDDKYSVSTSYMNKRLTGIGRAKEGKMHGEQITYMDNVYKTMGQRLDKMPGMENAREVVIDGMDLVETRLCFQDGQQVKTTTCSNE